MATTYNVYRDGNLIVSGLTSPTYTDTGLTDDVTYTYQVTQVNDIGEGPFSNAVDATPHAGGGSSGGGTPPPPPPPPPAGLAYGSINIDTKANLRAGPDFSAISHRFRARQSSTFNSVRFSQRGGPIYSGGNGGIQLITLQTDDGNGKPSGTVLATRSYTPGNPSGSWTTYLDLNMPGTPSVTAGNFYHVVFANSDSSNWISVNEVFIYGSVLNPRQPTYLDSDYAVLAKSGSSWNVEGQYTAVMDITYGNGAHDGMGYIGNIVETYSTINGANNKVREHFTVTGTGRSVLTAGVRVRRASGNSNLILTLENNGGPTIDTIVIPASSVPQSAAGGDNGGSVWVFGNFASARTLALGSTYNLVLSTASDTTYTAATILTGIDDGFDDSITFFDGGGEKTTNGGSSWASVYPPQPVDIQFYFK